MKHLIRLVALVAIIYVGSPRLFAHGDPPMCSCEQGCQFHDDTDYWQCSDFHDWTRSGNSCDAVAIGNGAVAACNGSCDMSYEVANAGTGMECQYLEISCHCRGQCMVPAR